MDLTRKMDFRFKGAVCGDEKKKVGLEVARGFRVAVCQKRE